MQEEHAPWQDEGLLRQKYLDEQSTSKEIADQLGCSKNTVLNWLHKHGIPTRHQSDPKPWKEKDRLYQMYWDEGKSTIEIGDELGCSPDTILNWMKKHDIDRRTPPNERVLHFRTNHRGYEVCNNKHNGEKFEIFIHKLVAIAEFGFDAVDGKLVHHKNEIPWDNRPCNLEPMNRSEHNSAHAKNPDAPWRDKELFEDMYIKNSQTEMAEMWNCGQPLISKWAKRHGLRD